MTRSRAPFGRAASLVLCAALGLSACSMFQSTGSEGQASAAAPGQQACDTLLAVPADTADLGLVQLVADGSASTIPQAAGQTAAQRPDWAAFLAAKVSHDPKMLVSFGVFGGRLNPRGKVATPGGSDNSTRDGNDARKFAVCLTARLRTAFAAAPDAPGTDPLRALADAGEQLAGNGGQLAGNGGQQRIVLATDGLSNIGCSDLRAASIGDRSAIAKIVQSCGPEIPVLPKDVHVEIVGLGKPAVGWPDISTPNREWLVGLWSALCQKTGATCDVGSSTPDASIGEFSAPAPDDPLVPMPAITVKGTNPVAIVVPEPLLFDFGSATLAPRAQSSIGEVVAMLSKMNYKRVEIQGHTDSQGPPEINQGLSERRAEAVTQMLAARGAHDTSAVGFGERQPRCPVQIVNGAPDQAAMACNRRVEILVYL
ncbi:OmpA family protein [Frankia sp. CiP3]|uniref:OmpA family protein n=1 Tax=Frankia sp. CiP3 TaxID=2880971 RepID=UPI001EF498B2|nr:OmpA family protein [Frankia sp. CiP3]